VYSEQKRRQKQAYRQWEAECQSVRDTNRVADKLYRELRMKEIVGIRTNSPFYFLTYTGYDNVPWLNAKGARIMFDNSPDVDIDNLILLNGSKSPRLGLLNAIIARALEDYCAGWDAIAINSDWSETKKDAEINKLRVTWDNSLANVESELLALQMDIAAIQTQMETKVLALAMEGFKTAYLEPADAGREIRTHLGSITLASERRSFLTANVEPAIFFALKTFPLPALRIALVDDEMLAYFRDLVTAKTSPDETYAQKQAKSVYLEAKMNLDSLKRARTPRELSSSRRIKLPSGPNLTERSIAANAAK